MALRDWPLWNSNATRRERQRRARRGPARRGGLAWDVLESRLAPAVSTWSGAVSSLWSDSGNWDVPPEPGNDLVFPAGAANLANTDDLDAATSFGSLTVAGSGYTIGGNAIALTGGVDSSQTSGSNTIALAIDAVGTGPLSVTVDQSGAVLVLGGAISGSEGLSKAGAGVLDLTGANTYSGTTAVLGGVLDVDSAQPGSPITLGAGTTLGGSGSVGTITASSATVSPGNPSPGRLSDSGDLNLDSGSTFTAALNGATAGSGYTQMVVAGQVNLGGATFAATAGFTPAGNEAFTIVNNTGASPVSGTFAGLSEGATLVISGQPYTISYTGGDGNDVVLTSEVVSTTTTLASSVSSLVSGQQVTLTATVAVVSPGAGTPSGTVEFFSGSTSLGTGTLDANGIATLATSALTTADSMLTATYQGNGNFTTSTSAALPVSVSQASTTTSVTVAPNPSTLGALVTLTATVAPASPGSGTPSGSVAFFSGSTNLGTVTLSGGVATLTTSSLSLGSNSIIAQYQADTNFIASTSPTMTATVASASTTALTASPTSFTSGQTITLTATVSPSDSSASATPTGTVEFFSGDTSLGTATLVNGVATLNTSSLTATGSVTATYDGDTNYTTSTSTAVTVTLVLASTTTVTSSPNPSVVGQTVTLAASVATGAGVPTGTIMFLSGGVPIGTVELDSTGSALLTIATLPSGSNAITAQYSGDDGAAASTSAAMTQTVSQASTTTTLTAAPLVSSAGQQVTLAANVAAAGAATGTPTGTITFLVGATTLGTAALDANGNASLPTTALGIGTSAITALYSGDANFAASTSTAVSATVSQSTQTSSITLSASTASPSAFSAVQFTAKVAAAGTTTTLPTGTVVFLANGAVVGTAALDGSGSATFSTTNLALGAETIVAVYQGDANFSGSMSAALPIAVGTSDQLFVNQMYLVVLNRPAEESGLEGWTAQIQQGLTRAQVVRLIMGSSEAKGVAQVRAASSASSSPTSRLTAQSSAQYKQQRISGLFQAVLGRPAEPLGLQFFTNMVDHGFTAKDIVIDLLGSDEYYSDITDALRAQKS